MPNLRAAIADRLQDTATWCPPLAAADVWVLFQAAAVATIA